MFQYYVPSGSAQPLPDHGYGSLLPWLEQLTMQSEELNLEHRAVLQTLNGLLLAIQSGGPTRITTACDLLSAKALLHFTKEKELMLAADYPDSPAHIEQHEELMRGIARIRFALTSGIGAWSPRNAQSMLEDWFVPHITRTDRWLANFLVARGAAPDAAPTTEPESADLAH